MLVSGDPALRSGTPVPTIQRVGTECPSLVKLIRFHGHRAWDARLPASVQAFHRAQERRWTEILCQMADVPPNAPKGRRRPIFLGACDQSPLT